jgi:protein SCO1
MNGRAGRVFLVLGAFATGLVLCLAVILLLVGRGAGPMGVQAAAIGGPFELVDDRGQPFGDQNLRGKPFLVFFGFTHCPDVCPTALFEMSEVMRSLGPDADRLGAVFITVDPERDTPEAMKDYLSSFDPHLHGLTGDQAALAAVAKA